MIAELVKQKPAGDWIELLNQAGVPCGPVNNIAEVFAEPQVAHLDLVHHVQHQRLGTLDVLGQPVNLSAAPQPEQFRYPAPDLGEHNEEILREIGLGDDEIECLVRSGAI
jgi:crotonobetainyl-CoA:carnitine CoA-transferase CaiB-like acyl-CoA transferase